MSSSEERFGQPPDVDEQPVAEGGGRWGERHGDDMFWLVAGGLGFILIVGTGISQLFDGPAAFLAVGAIWAVIAWRILALLNRRAERIARMQGDLGW